MTTRHFIHDCDECRFLGHFESDQGSWDLFHCAGGILGGSVIARFGNSGHEYASTPLKILLENVESINHDGLSECARRVLASTIH